MARIRAVTSAAKRLSEHVKIGPAITPGFSFVGKTMAMPAAHAPAWMIRERKMSPTAYTVQMMAAESALKLARDTGDVAAILAALATITRLVRLQYGAAKLAS